MRMEHISALFLRLPRVLFAGSLGYSRPLGSLSLFGHAFFYRTFRQCLHTCPLAVFLAALRHFVVLLLMHLALVTDTVFPTLSRANELTAGFFIVPQILYGLFSFFLPFSFFYFPLFFSFFTHFLSTCCCKVLIYGF